MIVTCVPNASSTVTVEPSIRPHGAQPSEIMPAVRTSHSFPPAGSVSLHRVQAPTPSVWAPHVHVPPLPSPLQTNGATQQLEMSPLPHTIADAAEISEQLGEVKAVSSHLNFFTTKILVLREEHEQKTIRYASPATLEPELDGGVTVVSFPEAAVVSVMLPVLLHV